MVSFPDCIGDFIAILINDLICPKAGHQVLTHYVGLLYWSEVASRVASEKFAHYFENFVKETPNISVSLVRDAMKQAILSVNKQLIEYRHPKTQQKVEIMDLGGQTTLGGFFIWRLNNQDRKQYKGTFGAFCVGTGDSPSFKYSASNGEWIEMFRDNGQMLPFYGLEAHNIRDPTFQTAEIGDCFDSDGVCDSFLDRKLPVLSKDASESQSADGVVKFLIDQTFQSHTSNHTDPDDVTVGAIHISVQLPTKITYPHTSEANDRTTEFFPNFSLSVDLPWGSYAYPSK